MVKSKKKIEETDTSTEEKIKKAARIVFHKKGYAATRTRDIAEEAGINLALLNYYFRSKEKLFELIIFESLNNFIQAIKGVFNNEETSLEEKIEILVSNYIDTFIQNPNIPLFMLNEIKDNPDELLTRIGMKDILLQSHFIKQLKSGIQEGKIAQIHPLHFMMNILGLCIFPFIASPILKSVGDLQQEEFNAIMLQRKKLIPVWIKSMMDPKNAVL